MVMCNRILKNERNFFRCDKKKVKSKFDVLQVSPDAKQFSITSPDRRIRVFWFATGKLRRVYDESLEVILIIFITFR